MSAGIRIAILLAVFAAGWVTNGWRLGEEATQVALTHQTEITKLKKEHDDQVASATAALLAAERRAKDQAQGFQATIAGLDAKLTKEKVDAEQTIADLERRVSAGTDRLRVQARITADTLRSLAGLQAGAAPGVAYDATVELSPDARQAYFSLKRGIADDQRKIIGLQTYITEALQVARVCAVPGASHAAATGGQ